MMIDVAEVLRQHGLGVLLGIAAGCVVSSASAQFRAGKNTTMTSVDLGGWCDGKQVSVALNEFGPGTSGRHYRPGHSFTWLLDGSETYTVEGKPPMVVKTGDVLHEQPGEVHIVNNDRPVKLLVFRVVEKGKPVTIRVP